MRHTLPLTRRGSQNRQAVTPSVKVVPTLRGPTNRFIDPASLLAILSRASAFVLTMLIDPNSVKGLLAGLDSVSATFAP